MATVEATAAKKPVNVATCKLDDGRTELFEELQGMYCVSRTELLRRAIDAFLLSENPEAKLAPWKDEK